MSWHQDGRLLVAGWLGCVALAGAIGSRRRGSHDVQAERAAVKELVSWTEIHDFPANAVQRQAWEDRGQMVCPHGNTEFRIYQMLPVHWDGETELAERAKIAADGGWEWDEQVGPYWAECHCNPPVRKSFRPPKISPFHRWAVAWWLPEGIEIRFG